MVGAADRGYHQAGQAFFISMFGNACRETFQVTDAELGTLCAIATLASGLLTANASIAQIFLPVVACVVLAPLLLVPFVCPHTSTT